MISDAHVKRLFLRGLSTLAEHMQPDEVLDTQFYRGKGVKNWVNQHPGGCARHMSVFNKFNVIPKYCFNCFKVSIKPRTVVELLKLMVVFEKLSLPGDSTRKCFVECREQVPGTYAGLIYCQDIGEGVAVMQLLQNVVQEEISKNIPVLLKRGCSEFALAYPDYARVEQGTISMEYEEAWQQYEDLADREFDIKTSPPPGDTFNRPAFTLQDAKVMLAWLRYAATIGDLSYLEISECILPPLEGLKRPAMFEPLEEGQ